MKQAAHNIDHAEIDKFDQLASRWWDPDSEFKPLHDINPLRLDYVNRRAPLADSKVIDVGCGGGLLSEGMARLGARVTGIDMGEAPLSVARLHLLESGAEVDYQRITAEEMAAQHPQTFDTCTCLEMLEHVPDPASVVQACADLVRPRGEVFFSTINRNPTSYLFAIVGADYVLNLLPKGTHDYKNFIRPSELETWSRAANIKLKDLTCMSYNPFTQQYALCKDLSVNYLGYGIKEN